MRKTARSHQNLENLSFKFLIDEKWATGVLCLDVQAVAMFSLHSSYCIGVGDNLKPIEVLTTALNQNLGHVVQASSVGLKDELNASALMIQDKKMFFKYPVSSILFPSQASSDLEKEICKVNLPFNDSKQKFEVLRKLEKYVQGFIKSQEFVAEVCTLADEMCSNALYNAPYQKRKIRSDKNRHAKIPNGKKAKLKAAYYDKRVLICCEDSFGSLDIRDLLDRIKSCYEQLAVDKVQIAKGGTAPKGGAGLGGFILYNSSCSLYVAVQKGVKTIICAVIPITNSQKRRAVMPKNLHFFEIGPKKKL